MTETLKMLQMDVKFVELQIASVELRKKYLVDNAPEDMDVNAWCADKTEDLEGVVGTIEVSGELGIVQVKPGYFDKAKYTASTDGQLLSTVLMSPSQCFFNAAILPGWQKWKPMYRHGYITDKTDQSATVVLDEALSSQQNLNINQSTEIFDVPFEYMNCGGKAFNNGDDVLVKFSGQNFENPLIIGFKDHPKKCPKESNEYAFSQQSGMFLWVEWDYGMR
jgi:hypothetical protein